jgi:hypothetical protein
MRSIAASLLLVGCVDYSIQDPDDDVEEPLVVREEFTQVPRAAVDILFVVDDTGSMAEEQASFASAAEAFVDTLEQLGISFQLGVTTTNPEDAGVLVGRPWIITAGAMDPSTVLANALSVGTDSPPPSAGLYAATRVFEDQDGWNRGFRRKGATLHVIFISDGDDESDAWLGDDPVRAFLDTLAGESDTSGLPARASAVVGDVPGGCSGPAGQATEAPRYTSIATATDGAVVSICDPDFAAVALQLGEATVDWTTVFPLQHTPVADSLLVEVNGVRALDGWTVDLGTPVLVFEVAPPPDATIDVEYVVAEAE